MRKDFNHKYFPDKLDIVDSITERDNLFLADSTKNDIYENASEYGRLADVPIS